MTGREFPFVTRVAAGQSIDQMIYEVLAHPAQNPRHMTPEAAGPGVVIHAQAPGRICDMGCWTDTWFARHGCVFNIAVAPRAEVRVEVHAADATQPQGRVRLHALDFGEAYVVPPPGPPWGPHPLLEAAIASVDLPPGLRLEIDVRGGAPAGAGTGSSAAVCVALLGALDALSPRPRTRRELATLAHRVETERLGRQSGIQDTIASACGGISFIEIDAYPDATVTRVAAPPRVLDELDERLLLVYLGQAHDSSALHEAVIASLEPAGPDAPALQALRCTAAPARDAIVAGDFEALGRAMSECTEAQGLLHPALVGPRARDVIAAARQRGALGWKVNGAGGEGGSLTLLCRDAAHADALMRELRAASPELRRIPIRQSPEGVRVVRTEPRRGSKPRGGPCVSEGSSS
jgi:D-glycero-alpha-D-manno-heptose-7-phosphate kinase